MNRLLLLAPRIATNRLWARAGEVPSFHIAPARTRDARDLITGNLLGTYNSASPAWAVGPDGVLFQPAANAPVIEYDPTILSCLGARIWGVVTNPRPYSERILAAPDVAAYEAVNSTLVQQTATSPIQGLSTVSKLTLNNGANTGNSSDGMNFGYIVNLTVNTVYTQSIFVKAAGSSVLRLRSNVTGQVFNIPIAGPASTPTGGISACTVQVFPNGWSRISWTFTTTTGAPGARTDHWTLKTDIANGTDGILMTGAMIQTGSTLGPYVPTTTLAASSTADVWSITGADFSRIWNQSQGTVFINWNLPDVNSTRDDQTLFLADASGVPGVAMRMGYSAGSRRLRYYAQTSAGAFVYAIDGAANTSSVGKTAFAFSSLNDSAASENGAAVLADSIGDFTNQTTTQIVIGSTGSSFANGYIRELAIFRSRRPNANLQAMTQ